MEFRCHNRSVGRPYFPIAPHAFLGEGLLLLPVQLRRFGGNRCCFDDPKAVGHDSISAHAASGGPVTDGGFDRAEIAAVFVEHCSGPL